MAFSMASLRSWLPTPRTRRFWVTTASTTTRPQSSVREIPGSTTSLRATLRANATRTSGLKSKTLSASGSSPSPAPLRPFLTVRVRCKTHLAVHLSEQLVVDQTRRTHKCGNRNQRTLRHILHRIEAVRVYDLEVIDTYRAFLGEFRASGGGQFRRPVLARAHQSPHLLQRSMQRQRPLPLQGIEVGVARTHCQSIGLAHNRTAH